MSERTSCARCGAETPPENGEGYCTRCLLERGLGDLSGATEAPEPGLTQGLRTEHDARDLPKQPHLLRQFGDYELLEEIARGGMGIVYRARQLSLERIVAVKMILAGPFASEQIIRRFRGEVTAAALLQHPNIVAIHDVGVQEGQHYFSMALVEGQNLAQLVGNRPLPAARSARYLKLIAEAIHYAHGQGILHRDLKPSNILVDSATDQPRITDFGLAKRLDGDASITVTGQVLGSPSFMPPEQACSDHGKVSRHSDVYGLGAILYYLLTARPPFQADSLASVVAQVLHNEPVGPRTLNTSVPRDLETICLKCLSKEPHKRYATAGDLAQELGRFLQDEPIRARSTTQREKAWRWCRRNPVVASLGLALALAIGIGFATVSWQLRRVSREESITRRNLYTADMNRVYQAWSEGNLARAEELLDKHRPQRGKEDLRGFEWRLLSQLCRDESRHTFTNIHFRAWHRGLALAADGHTVIAASDGSLKWLDGEKQAEVQSLTVGTNPILGLAMSSDQPGLIAYRTDRIRVLSPQGESLLGGGLAPEYGGYPIQDDNFDAAFDLSRDGAWLAASGANNLVQIFQVKTGRPVSLPLDFGDKDTVFCLALSPDSRYLACATRTTEIHLLTAPKLERVAHFKAHTAFITRLAFDPTGRVLASGANDGHVRLWSIPDGRLIADLAGHHGLIADLAFSPDGRRLATGGVDRTVRIWDLASRDAPTLLHGHRDAVTAVLFSRSGEQLYTASHDQTVKLWDLSTHGPTNKLGDLTARDSTNLLRVSDWADEVNFSRDGTMLAVADFTRNKASVWRLADRRQLQSYGDYTVPCRGVNFSPFGGALATSAQDGTVQVWNLSPKAKRFDFAEGAFSFHPTKPLLVIAGTNLSFWDWQTGRALPPLPHGPTGAVSRAVFSPDGTWLALGMWDGTVSVREFATGRTLYSFRQQSAGIEALCFSNSGMLLASGGKDSWVELYDLRNGSCRPLKGNHNLVQGMAFAPGDRTLVCTSWDGYIRFWSLANYEVALTLAQGGGPVNSVAFSQDKNLMATSGSDGTVRLWPAAPDERETRTTR